MKTPLTKEKKIFMVMAMWVLVGLAIVTLLVFAGCSGPKIRPEQIYNVVELPGPKVGLEVLSVREMISGKEVARVMRLKKDLMAEKIKEGAGGKK
jgi:hypothetical protein